MNDPGPARKRLALALTAAVVGAAIAVVAAPYWVHPLFGTGVAFIGGARLGAIFAAEHLAEQGHLWAYHPAFHWTVRILFTLIGLLLCADGLIRRFLMPAPHGH